VTGTNLWQGKRGVICNRIEMRMECYEHGYPFCEANVATDETLPHYIISDDGGDEQFHTCQNCGNAPAEPEHPCPYAEDILGEDILCTCCDECSQNCMDAI